MIKYLCDVENCNKEAKSPDTERDWLGQEMFEPKLEGYRYFWARVGFANITFCPEHRKQAMMELCNLIRKKYFF